MRRICVRAPRAGALTSFRQLSFCTVSVRTQGCHIGSFGSKNQTFVSFESHFAPKFLFAYLVTFWLFCNFFRSIIFPWRRGASGGERTLSFSLPSESVPALHCTSLPDNPMDS